MTDPKAGNSGCGVLVLIAAFIFILVICNKSDDETSLDKLTDNWREMETIAAKGNKEAQYLLGLDYYNGGEADLNVQDYKMAVYWFQKAADSGQIDAQYYLGKCYQYGYGFDQIEVNKKIEVYWKKGVYWYKKAAEKGHAEAQCDLGYMYMMGYGVNIDETKAVYWWKKAAKQGHKQAQRFLDSDKEY